MKRALVLLWREWREQRVLILAFFLLGPLALLAARAVFLEEPVDPLPARVLAPILAVLFAVALAAEAFTTRDGLGRLPASRFALWCAKFAFVAGLAAVFFAWLIACECLRREWLGLSDVSTWLEYRSGAEMLLIVPVVACVAACSTLLQRPLAAALLGVMVALGPVAAVAWDWDESDYAFLRTVVHTRGEPAFVLVCVALMAASLAAYSAREGASRARRVVLSLTTLAAILAPSGAWAWSDFRDRVSITAGDPRLGLRWACASPDGRFVAFEVMRRAPWFESHDQGEPVRAVWIIETATCALRELPIGTALTMPAFLSHGSSWTADGELVVISRSGPLHKGDEARVEWIEPASGAVLRSIHPWSWYSGMREDRSASRAAGEAAACWFEDEPRDLRVQVSPDTRFAYRSTSKGLRVVDAATGERVLEGRWSPVDFERYGPGRALFVAGRDGPYTMLENGGMRTFEVEPGLRVTGLGGNGTLLALRENELLHLDREGEVLAVLYAPFAFALQ